MKEKYCEFCGTLCKEYKDKAEKYSWSYCGFMYGYTGVPYEKYDKKTGKRNYIEIQECPNRKKTVETFWGKEKTKIDDRHSRFIGEITQSLAPHKS